MNEMELDLLTGLVPRQQILLKRPDLAKVLTLTVDPKSYWIYTNTPVDNARVAGRFASTASRRASTASRRRPERRRCAHVAVVVLTSLSVLGLGRSCRWRRRPRQTTGHPRGDGDRRKPDSAPDAAALHDDDRAARRRGDPRRHLRRPGLLGHQRRRRTSRT